MALPSADRERIRALVAEGLADVAEPFEDDLAAAIRRVVAEAVAATGFLDSAPAALSAAAGPPVDLSALGAISGAWGAEAAEATVKHYSGIYEKGLVSGYVSTEKGESYVRSRIEDVDVVNVQAAEAARSAANRMTGVSDDAWERARTSLAEGIAAGDDLDTRRRRLEDLLDTAESRARTVARTEATAAYNEGALSLVDLLGDDAPGWKEWLATTDSRTRDDHWEADGQVVRNDRPFRVGGYPMLHPGDRSAPAAQTVNCRCALLLLEEPPPGWKDPDAAEPGEELAPPLPVDTVLPEEVALDAAVARASEVVEDLGGWDEIGDSVDAKIAQADMPELARKKLGRDLGFEAEAHLSEVGHRADKLVHARLRERGLDLSSPPSGRLDGVAARARVQAIDVDLSDRFDAISRELEDLYPREGREELWRYNARIRWEAEGVARTDASYQNLLRLQLDAEKAARSFSSPGDPSLGRVAGRVYAEEVRALLRERRGAGGVRAKVDMKLDQFSLKDHAVWSVAEDSFPERWVMRHNDRGSIGVAPATDRAGYWNDSRLQFPANGTDGYRTSTAIHEFAHRMEDVVPGLREMEAQFWHRRTDGQVKEKLAALTGNTGYKDWEVAIPDDFANPYIGKEYFSARGRRPSRENYEVFSMGVEVFLSPVKDPFSWSAWGARAYQDDGFRRFVLGALFGL